MTNINAGASEFVHAFPSKSGNSASTLSPRRCLVSSSYTYRTKRPYSLALDDVVPAGDTEHPLISAFAGKWTHGHGPWVLKETMKWYTWWPRGSCVTSTFTEAMAMITSSP